MIPEIFLISALALPISSFRDMKIIPIDQIRDRHQFAAKELMTEYKWLKVWLSQLYPNNEFQVVSATSDFQPDKRWLPVLMQWREHRVYRHKLGETS